MYIIIFLLVVFNLIIEFYKAPKVIKQTVNTITIIVLVLFAGLRYESGYDYSIYSSIYSKVNDFSISEYSQIHSETLFLIFVTAIKKTFSSFQYIFIISSSFIFYILVKSIKEYKLYFGVVIFVYFTTFYFNSNFSQIRQGIVTVMVLYSIKHIIDQKFIPFILILIIGSFIQSSILMFFPMYFLSRKWITIDILLVLSILSLFLLNLDLVSFIINTFPFPSYIEFKVMGYLNNPEYTRSTIPIFGIILRIIYILIFYYFGRKIKDNVLYQTSLYIYIFGFIFYLLFGELTLISTRLINLYGIVQVILFSIIIKANAKIYREVIILLMIILGIYIFTKTIYIDGKSSFIPYRSIITKTI